MFLFCKVGTFVALCNRLHDWDMERLLRVILCQFTAIYLECWMFMKTKAQLLDEARYGGDGS